jgi:hypothetical protein
MFEQRGTSIPWPFPDRAHGFRRLAASKYILM